MRSYGYNDSQLVTQVKSWGIRRWVALILALLFIFTVWFALNQKLLFGSDWISETYDNEDWRTNEGNLHTYGAWDFETHVWKTEYIKKYFPNFHWNPYWYLGMPLLKYYQSGFYVVHLAVIALSGLSAPRAALLLIIFSHLLATVLTFLLCLLFCFEYFLLSLMMIEFSHPICQISVCSIFYIFAPLESHC